MKTKLLYAGLVLMIAAAMVLLFWSFKPGGKIIVSSEAVLTNGEVFEQGDLVTWVRKGETCNYGTGTQNNVVFIENVMTGVQVKVAELINPAQTGCVSDFQSGWKIPDFIPFPDGHYKFVTYITYSVSPLNEETVTVDSPTFELRTPVS